MFKRILFLLVVVCAVAVCSASAEAVTLGPGWEVDSHSYPTSLSPGGSGVVAINVFDVGSVGASGTLTDTLPEGVSGVSSEGWVCDGARPDVCTQEVGVGVKSEVEVILEVSVAPGTAEGEVANEVRVEGGGAPGPTNTSNILSISSRSAGFGFANADAWFTNADGSFDMQAGSHPYEATVEFALNTEERNNGLINFPAGGEARNLTASLPPGLLGNPSVLPRCTRHQFDLSECPASTQVGVATAGLGGDGRRAHLRSRSGYL